MYRPIGPTPPTDSVVEYRPCNRKAMHDRKWAYASFDALNETFAVAYNHSPCQGLHKLSLDNVIHDFLIYSKWFFILATLLALQSAARLPCVTGCKNASCYYNILVRFM